MEFIQGESYLIKKGGLECYCTFKKVTDEGFLFDNSGEEVLIKITELKDCVKI